MAFHKSFEHRFKDRPNFYYRYGGSDGFVRFARPPRKDSHLVVCVSQWTNIPFRREQWVGIWCGEDEIVLSSKEIHALSKELRRLEKGACNQRSTNQKEGV